MARDASLARSLVFEGLTDDELDVVAEHMRPRQFAPNEQLCEAGEASDRIWLITGGLVSWTAAVTAGGEDIELRMRKGDVIGAQDAITGKERSATVVASMHTSALELDAEDLISLARRFPQILINVIQMQRERLFRASARSAALFSGSVRSAADRGGEEVGLVAGESLAGALPQLVAAAKTASTREVDFLDRSLSFAGALTASDDLASESATVLIPGDLDPENLAVMLDELDRVVALAGNADEAERLGRVAEAAEGRNLEVILVSDEARRASRVWSPEFLKRVVRDCPRQQGFPLADADLAWVARHLTRTKLGVALGAGGAKGYAHVGVLQVLEEAGYTVDFAGGSSIGGFVATHLALGYDAQETYERFRRAFNDERLGKLFGGAFGGGAAGEAELTAMLKEATEERFFSHTVIPLVIMAVDLTDRGAIAQRTGPLWESLLGALAVAGVFPPLEREEHRLVDAIALVPVPTAAVIEDGADVVLSVNLLGAETLEEWPDAPKDEADEPAKAKRKNMLDTLFEVMDLSQLDTAARHAELADVVVTPRFGPADWRDFGLADLFLAAGRAAALEQLPSLQALCRPVDLEAARRETAFA
jgi:predicted acylesterase/phospholipase RssA/CRP-like cAMP-binding protein